MRAHESRGSERETVNKMGTMRTGRSRRLLLTLLLTLPLGAAGCSERERITPPGDVTPTGLVESGWDAFEDGDFEGARGDFAQAAADSAGFGEAHLGLGWARLNLGQNNGVLDEAIQSFTTAFGLGETGADALGGRAAANLARNNPNAALTDALAARTASPTFVFEHRTTFNSADLRLIEAFALAAAAQFSGALTTADAISASGIVQSNPATFVVDGVTFPSFGSAVLAHLQKLSNQVAG